MKSQTNIISYLIAVVSAIATFIVVGVLSYFIACYFAPPMITDPTTGLVHGLMPIGQSMIAIVFATIGSIISFIRAVKYL